MFKKLNIYDEKNKHLRTVCHEAKLPLNQKYRDLIKQCLQELKYSQIDQYSQKYNLRPGMGLAFPQLGIDERIITLVHEYEPGKFQNYVIVNPRIISNSEEMIAAESGEGCLSVNREVEGHVARFARVTIIGFDMDGNPVKVRAREELSIAFQHEIDHLNGILFYDRINPNKPFFTEQEIRLI